MAPRKPKVPKRTAAKDNKVTLGDTASMKHALDTAVTDCFVEWGYEEDHTFSNIRLVLSFLSIALALVAQFYPGTLQQNWYLIFACVTGYGLLSVTLTLFVQFKQKDAILITKSGRKGTAPLRVSSLLPKFSEDYTLSIEAAQPLHHPEIKQTEMIQSIGKYFYADGTLADHILSQDLSKLLHSVEKKE